LEGPLPSWLVARICYKLDPQKPNGSRAVAASPRDKRCDQLDTAMAWIPASEALAASGLTGEQMRALMLASDATGRLRLENGTTWRLRPEQWVGRDIDWAASRIDAAGMFELRMIPLDGSRPAPLKPKFLPLEIDDRTLPAPKAPPRSVGGRPSAIPPEALIEVGAWLAANGIPDKLVEVEDKLREAIADSGAAEPAESTIRHWAGRLVEAHRRALG
jgi:hypothetical protein